MNSQQSHYHQLQTSTTVTATSTTTATTIGHNVMERASAEITKRINGLTLRSKSSNTVNGSGVTSGNVSGSGFFGGNQQQSHSIKTSMIDRMTNVFCNNVLAPDKPARVLLTPSKSVKSSMVLKKVYQNRLNRGSMKFDQLMADEKFLAKFFKYFEPIERTVLARVCSKWRDVLYRYPNFWLGLVPMVQCRELRNCSTNDRAQIYNSFLRRGFHSLCLISANDNDALDLIQIFVLSAKHVHSLSIRYSSISDRALESLLDHLQALFELELMGCNEITETGLWACLTPRIVSLTLTDSINIADEAVGAVAQLLPSLYEFSLQAYHVTDSALGYFSSKQSHTMSILRLLSCLEVTNHGIVNIVHSLPNLTVLSLSGCSKITDDGIELIAENLSKLRSLDLSWCSRITDASLEYIACDLNQLEELTLDRCVHITDIGVGYISTMSSITVLSVRWCVQLRDFSIQHLCAMKHLQVLSLAGCSLLTSNGLATLIQLKYLQELELTNCSHATYDLLEYLRLHLPPRCLLIE